MKRFLWLSFFLICSGRLVAGQGRMLKPGKAKAQEASSESGEVVEAGPSGCLVEKAGTYRLRGEGFVYILKGHEKELAGHDGDEVRVTGAMVLPQGLPPSGSYPAPTIQVKTVQILQDNNPAGKAPALGPVAGWQTIMSPLYGLRFRVPGSFTTTEHVILPTAVNFVATEGTATLGSFNIPNATFANTNFRDGSFSVFVNPKIHTEGACNAFADFQPKLTSSATVHGIRFAHTEIDGVAAGTASSTHNLHTFENGLCYEFYFNFFELDGTGWDYPICAVQWINRQNERQLTQALLSEVQFVKPRFERAGPARLRPTGPPLITPFTHAPVSNKNVRVVRFAWSAEGADYVQIHFPLIRNLTVLGQGFYFYNQNTHNFPPSGHADFLLGNHSKGPVTLQFKVIPFRAGVAYPSQSKTISISLNSDR